MFRLRKKEKREVLRITEYMVSGGAYFWSGYGAFFVCDQVFHFNLWWAKLTANLIGWLINFGLQRYWVFNNPKLAKHHMDVTTRYIALTAANFLIDYFIILGLKTAGLTPYIGQFISAAFFTFWNYIWYRLWVFPEKFPRHKRTSLA